jgi:hypothetical protein
LIKESNVIIWNKWRKNEIITISGEADVFMLS